jgi:4-carboxymuconolactone decarboxylase
MSNESSFGRYQVASDAELSDEERATRDMLIAGPRRGVTGPYRIWAANGPLARTLVDLDQHLNTTSSLLPADREIAVLVTGQRWRADYVLTAHASRARESGVPAEAVADIVGGVPPVLTDPRHGLVYAVCQRLYDDHGLSDDLFRRASEMLGTRGLTDLLALLGYYTAIALTLNAYSVSG